MSTTWLDDPQWLAPPRTVRVGFDDGSFVLRSPEPLRPYARCIGEWLERWAAETPDAPAFAERAPDGGWRRLSWAQTRAAVGRIAQGLLDLKLAPQAPIVVLSDNALDHLLLLLAGMHIGVPVCTVSSAYCRLTQDYSKIHGILNTLGPALVYASDAQVYGPALAHAGLHAPVVFSRGAEGVTGALEFAALSRPETAAVMQAFEAITPDTHAKYLLTSGSTGHPKVVINTHRMLCANQQMIAQVWRFLQHEKPVLVDWLPWSHTFGGNHNLNMVLRNGGTLVIDEGRPAPGLVQRSVANLAEVQPTIWFNVPRGFDMALPLLEADPQLAQRVFERLRAVFYAGAALPQATWDASAGAGEEGARRGDLDDHQLGLDRDVARHHQRALEAGPRRHHRLADAGGGAEVRRRQRQAGDARSGRQHLSRLSRRAAAHRQAFDAEGYYIIGDAGFLADESRPESGVVFNGRVAEDFKLGTGTWVSVGTLRVRVVSALAPHAQDVVVTGHDRNEVGVLVFPTPQAAALPPGELRAQVAAALKGLVAEGGGSSQAPVRALLLSEPPSADAGEITDKGYLNQRAVLKRRDALVQALYAGGPEVIVAR